MSVERVVIADVLHSVIRARGGTLTLDSRGYHLLDRALGWSRILVDIAVRELVDLDDAVVGADPHGTPQVRLVAVEQGV